jgi:hypothetical protein
MALATHSESVDILSQQDKSKIIKDGEADVKDTFINRTAISPNRYNSIYGTLMGYADGAPIEIEYYHRIAPIVSQTGEIDYTIFRHSVHDEYSLIHDFELRLEGQLDISYDEETTIMTIVGSGLTYPGLNPYVGDVFLYALPDNQIGIFIIDNVTRLSIQQGTYHKVSFRLVEYADEELGNVEKLNQSVSEELYFDKQKYLSHNATLLTTDSYIHLRTLRRYRELLVQHFFQTYYYKEYNTVMRLDGVYDPYVVEFIQAKVSYLDVPELPMQIYPEATDYYSSIWFLLTGATHCDVSALRYKFYTLKNTSELWDANITGLLNRQFIHLDDSELINTKKEELLVVDPNEEETYILSKAFYMGDKTTMTEFEIVLYDTIIDYTSLDINNLIEVYLKDFRNLEQPSAFYFICLYIYLIDVAITNIT